MVETSKDAVWPALPSSWWPTRDTLTLWLQVIGKVRIARAPLLNHWWNAPLYLTASGLTTSLIPAGPGRSFAIDLDFTTDRLDVVTTDGLTRTMRLEPGAVSDFHRDLMGTLDELGLHTEIWPVPVELPASVPFTGDDTHRDYDPRHAHLFWRALVQTERVLQEFRAGFLGKSSPVHLFWGALDLATTRFSGRKAPPHPGGVPNCGPHVMREAYSHEVSSSGFWPAGGGEGIFYAYAYPEPEGYRKRPAGPEPATFDDELGEFVLPYAAVRTSPDPDRLLLDFFQATYEAAALCAGWDRINLERPGWSAHQQHERTPLG